MNGFIYKQVVPVQIDGIFPKAARTQEKVKINTLLEDRLTESESSGIP